MTAARLRFATSVGTVAIVVGLSVATGCGGSEASITRTVRCSDDFGCPLEQSCDRGTGLCVDTILRDNFISGSFECRLKAPGDTSVELGRAKLTGSVNGARMELTSASCRDGDGRITIVPILGQAALTSVSALLTFPSDRRTVDGTAFDLDPYVELQGHPPVAHIRVSNENKGEGAGEARTVIAYGRSGSIMIDRAPTDDDPTIRITIDVELVPAKPTPPCTGLVCETQADCGVPPGDDILSYPICDQTAKGSSIHRCRQFCSGDGSICRATGGTCSNGLCVRPWCVGQELPAACATATSGEACLYCCDLKTNGAGLAWAFGLLYPKCACDVDAPCRAECGPLCTQPGPDIDNRCATCKASPAYRACRAEQVTACGKSKDCLAWAACTNECT